MDVLFGVFLCFAYLILLPCWFFSWSSSAWNCSNYWVFFLKIYGCPIIYPIIYLSSDYLSDYFLKFMGVWFFFENLWVSDYFLKFMGVWFFSDFFIWKFLDVWLFFLKIYGCLIIFFWLFSLVGHSQEQVCGNRNR